MAVHSNSQPPRGIPPYSKRFEMLITALMFALIWHLVILLSADGVGSLDLVILLTVLHTLAVPYWPSLLLKWSRLERFLVQHRAGIEADRSAVGDQRRDMLRRSARGQRILLGIWFVRMLIFGLLFQTLFVVETDFQRQAVFMLVWLASTQISDWRLQNILLFLPERWGGRC